MEKRKFAIVSDSSTDLPKEYFRDNNVYLVNLGYQINGKVYGGEDGEDLDTKEFYSMLRNGSMPTTY